MIGLISGIVLLIIPFVLLGLFSDKKRGFVYALFFLFLFHTALAFFTQLFGIFYYWVIIASAVMVDLILLVFYIREKNKIKISFKLPKIDWILLSVVIIACITLYQVHYNYTGKINLATDATVSYHEVKNMEYVYPYFSDEWYAVSLIKHSINSHALPLWDTLNNSFFLNLEMFFHSLVAEIILILSLDPLTQYILISMFFNVLIIILAYTFLRLNNISKLSSAIASLSILYITCGANLPGVWHFIPVHLGIIFCLIGFCFLSADKFYLALLASLPVIIFYGPLFVFYGLSLAVFALFKFFKAKEEILKVSSYFLIALFLLVPISYVILIVSPLSGLTEFVASKAFYVSFTGFNISQFYFYNIIPIWTILLSVLGIRFIFEKRKWLLATFLLGIVYWIFYSFSIYRFVIEYERVVFFVSIIVTIISGFGLAWLEKYFKNFKFPVFKYIEIGAIILFLLMMPFYTRINNWEKLILVNPQNGVKSFPKSPANNYLAEDDLKIFENIKSKKFLSIPWKGTVIGVATENYPVVVKQGNIRIGKEETISKFLNSDCKTKKNMAKNMKLDYVYIYDFDCPGFEKVNRSQEDIIFYKVDIN
jgi:hypothetical protein